MAFVQIVEFRTSKVAEMQAVADEWEKATAGKRKAGRRVCAKTGTTLGATSMSSSSVPTMTRWRTQPFLRPIRFRRR